MGYHFFENREVCIYRMKKSTFEFLSILEQAPIRLFIPRGCVFDYRGPNRERLEIVEHNPNKFSEIFENLVRDKINVIGYDQYVPNYRQKFEWWGRFFYELLSWKGTHMRLPMGVYLDELADIVPNKGESLCPEHQFWGNQIMDSIDAYRRSNIRIVAITHTLTDIKKTFRHQFHYWFIKRTSRETVPWRYVNYSGEIERLESWEVLVQDKKGNFNRRPSPVWVWPKNVSVYTKSSQELIENLDRRETVYAHRLRLVDENLKLLGLTVRQRQVLMGFSTPSSVVMFEQRYPIDQIPFSPINPESEEWKPLCRRKSETRSS